MATGIRVEDDSVIDAEASRELERKGYRVEPVVVGRGGYGRLFRARSANNNSVAIKDMDITWMNPRFVERELVAMREILHPNIVKMIDSFKLNDHLYIIMNYANQGDVDNAMDNKKLNESIVHLWFGQVCRAVRHMHGLGFAHQDIKTANVLIHDGQALLSDFGYTLKARDDAKKVILSTERLREVYFISPPEVLIGQAPYDPFAADVWQLGVFLFIMWNKCYPFGLYNQDGIQNMIKEQRFCSYTVKFTRKCPFTMQALFDDMFTFEPARRITVETVLKSQWMVVRHTIKKN